MTFDELLMLARKESVAQRVPYGVAVLRLVEIYRPTLWLSVEGSIFDPSWAEGSAHINACLYLLRQRW